MSRIPTKDEILAWIADNPASGSKRDIAKAFGIKGAARIDLKKVLRELETEGHLEKRRKSYRDPDKLPPVSVLQVIGPDADGDVFCRPLEWRGEGPEPRILFSARSAETALAAGDRILARMQEVQGEEYHYIARLIRKIGTNPRRILGVFRKSAEGGRIVGVSKGSDKEWRVGANETQSAKDGELVEAELAGPAGRMTPRARIVERLGNPGDAKSVSLIAIHEHGIPDDFPHDVIAEAEATKEPALGKRKDLRDLPLVTIDPSDARDHDDAVYAHAEGDGHVIWVAIADVAQAVPPGSGLDREARTRGNSSYFPDRVVPMLPDRLSGDLCSLHEGVDRACLAVRMVIDGEGRKTGQTFHRAIMRSAASLHYEEVQAARDGAPNERCAALMDEVITPLYEAYEALLRARAKRQPLELDLPERQIILAPDGKVTSVAFKDRLDAHKLIEECMVLANVAAAETLISKRQKLLFRVHEEPDATKIDALRETAESAGFTLAKGQVLKTAQLNRLLEAATDTDHVELINYATLRSMTQAYYFPENFGHFGLALRAYAHFTSPIRRYADLVVHRALIAAHGWGKDGLTPEDAEGLEDTAKHISDTERRSMQAERDTTDRYLAAYLSDRVGAEFTGRISGIARFGAFVKLDETGADGLLPIRSLGAEYFHFDAEAQTLMGSDSGLVLSIGDRVTVKLAAAVPVTGGLELELIDIDGRTVARGPGSDRRKRPARRAAGKAKAKRSKLRKKASARRR